MVEANPVVHATRATHATIPVLTLGGKSRGSASTSGANMHFCVAVSAYEGFLQGCGISLVETYSL